MVSSQGELEGEFRETVIFVCRGRAENETVSYLAAAELMPHDDERFEQKLKRNTCRVEDTYEQDLMQKQFRRKLRRSTRGLSKGTERK